jgi:hypothetical protein
VIERWPARGGKGSDQVVVEFAFTAPARTTIWLVLSNREVSVCTNHPGYDADVVSDVRPPVLSGVFSGLDDWHHQIARGAIEVSGPPRLTKALPRWFAWSPFAPICAPPRSGWPASEPSADWRHSLPDGQDDSWE